MLLCSSWKMKYFNGSKTREITWNDPFAILRFPLSKLVFNSLWNDNNFFRAFLLLYTIFKERLNLKPKKKLCFSIWSFYCHWASCTLFQYSILSVLTHCSLVSEQKILWHKNKQLWNIQLTTTNPYEYVMFCRAIFCFWYSSTKKLMRKI